MPVTLPATPSASPSSPALIRFPRALKPCLDLAPLHLVRRAGHLDRNCEASCPARRIHRKPAPPEMGNGQHRRFAQRTGRDLDRVPDAFAVGERDEEIFDAQRMKRWHASMKIVGCPINHAVVGHLAIAHFLRWREKSLFPIQNLRTQIIRQYVGEFLVHRLNGDRRVGAALGNALGNDVFRDCGNHACDSIGRSVSVVFQPFRRNVVQFAKKLDDLLDLLDVTADALAATWDQRADQHAEVSGEEKFHAGGNIKPTIH